MLVTVQPFKIVWHLCEFSSVKIPSAVKRIVLLVSVLIHNLCIKLVYMYANQHLCLLFLCFLLLSCSSCKANLFGNVIKNSSESWSTANLVFRREICRTHKWFQLWCKPHTHRPATSTCHGLSEDQETTFDNKNAL